MQNAVLIGYGYWGPNIAKNLNRSKDFTLYGICDVDENKLAKARELYGDSIRYYRDYNEVIADSEVTACAVALRNEIGQVVARAVLNSNRHLFMEKPMAIRIEDALLLKELARKHGAIIHVDHILVYHPIIRRIKSMLDSGEIGELISFESNRANLGPYIKQDMNAMWDLAVHDLAILDYLSGGHPALSVNCTGAKYYGNQEIVTYLTVKYENLAAMIKSSWFSPLKERSIMISGTKKMVLFDDLMESEKLMVYDKGVDFDKEQFNEYGVYEAKVRMGDLYVPNIEPEDSLLNSLTHFAECIRDNKESISGPDQAIRVLSILTKADDKLAEMR
jgi:predicted dehydrogenase